MAGRIAHDFNNILGTMLGFSELLLPIFADSSEEKGGLTMIYQAGERAAKLVSQILTFSRAEVPDLKPLSFIPFLRDVIKMVRAVLSASIEILDKINVKGDLMILANETQMQQVIINLCTNAAHAMKEKGGLLEIQLSTTSDPDSQVQSGGLSDDSLLKITIKDSGQGIPPEIRDRIFDPFFTTKKKGEGTGLGLSIVHGIVESHNGRILFESESGVGTVFHLFLPVIKAKEQDTTSSDITESTGMEHILVVEDETSLGMLYEMALTQVGYKVTLVRNGAEALDKLSSQPELYSLVFSDQAMPKMTGLELSREVLKIRPEIPIILATGYDVPESKKGADSLNISAYLMKPVRIAHLSQLIRDTLDRQPTG